MPLKYRTIGDVRIYVDRRGVARIGQTPSHRVLPPARLNAVASVTIVNVSLSRPNPVISLPQLNSPILSSGVTNPMTLEGRGKKSRNMRRQVATSTGET